MAISEFDRENGRRGIAAARRAANFSRREPGAVDVRLPFLEPEKSFRTGSTSLVKDLLDQARDLCDLSDADLAEAIGSDPDLFAEIDAGRFAMSAEELAGHLEQLGLVVVVAKAGVVRPSPETSPPPMATVSHLERLPYKDD